MVCTAHSQALSGAPQHKKPRASTYRRTSLGTQNPVHPPAGSGFRNLFQVGPELPLSIPLDFVQMARLTVKPRWSGLNPLSAEPPVVLTWAGKVQKEQETPPQREGSTVRQRWVFPGSCGFLVCVLLAQSCQWEFLYRTYLGLQSLNHRVQTHFCLKQYQTVLQSYY